jgi:hypothetical protein
LQPAASPASPPACDALVAVANLLAAFAEVSVGTARATETVATTATFASFENFTVSPYFYFYFYFVGWIFSCNPHPEKSRESFQNSGIFAWIEWSVKHQNVSGPLACPQSIDGLIKTP